MLYFFQLLFTLPWCFQLFHQFPGNSVDASHKVFCMSIDFEFLHFFAREITCLSLKNNTLRSHVSLPAQTKKRGHAAHGLFSSLTVSLAAARAGLPCCQWCDPAGVLAQSRIGRTQRVRRPAWRPAGLRPYLPHR